MPIVSSPPPVTSGAKKTTGNTRKVTTPIKDQRREALEGIGQILQLPLIGFRQLADAATIGIHWPNVSREVAELADSQEAIARVVDPLIKIGPYTGLVAAVLPMFLQLAVNHGRIPAGIAGTVPANSLSAQMEASLAAAEMEALQAQLEAEKAAQRMRDEIKRARKTMADSQASQATTVDD